MYWAKEGVLQEFGKERAHKGGTFDNHNLKISKLERVGSKIKIRQNKIKLNLLNAEMKCRLRMYEISITPMLWPF